MNKVSAPPRGDSTAVDRLLGHVWRWLAVMVASGWLIGVSIYALVEYELAEYLMKNNLEVEDRQELPRYGVIGVAFVACIYLAVWFVRVRKDRSVRPTQAFTEFGRIWFVTLCTPLLVGLFLGDMAADARLLSLAFIAIIAGCVMAMVHMRPPPAAPASDTPVSPLPAWHRDRMFWATAGVCVIYGLAMTHLSLTEHWSIATHAYDLGIYDNIMWNTTHGDVLGCSICKGGNHSSGHFDPVLVLLAPLYSAFPRAETLLVFQAWWLATAGLPLYLIGRRVLPDARGYCVVLVAIFFMHPGLHGVNLFDFHSLALCVPLVLWAVHCIDSGAKWWFPLVLGLLLLVREDMPLIVLFIGAYAILRRRPIWGLLTIIAAIAYLVTIKLYFMPDPDLLMKQSKDASSHIYYYEDMIPYPDEGMRGLIVSTFGNPAFTAKVIFLNAAKNFYIFGLLLPLLFLPLLGGSKRVMMLYGLAFIGLVTREHVYSFHFQYSAVLLPFLVASVPDATRRVTRWAAGKGLVASEAHLRRTLMWGIITATFLVSACYGALIPNTSFKGGWNRLNRYMSADDKEHYARVREMVETIPQDAVVCATTDLVPHVSNRAEVYSYPTIQEADYLLIDAEALEKKRKQKRRLASIRRKYETVLEHDGVELLRRTAKKSAAKRPKPAEREEDDESVDAIRRRGSTKKKSDKKKSKDDEEDAEREDAEGGG